MSFDNAADIIFVSLPAHSRGFIRSVTLHNSGYTGALLVQSRLDIESYTEDLFHKLALTRPPSLSTALPIRRAQFLAGRAMARSALQALGLPAPDIPIAFDRRPLWPQSSAGSIAHTREYCACFVIAHQGWQAGVDIEAVASGHALESILTVTASDYERCLIERQTILPRDQLATLLFSAKETLFKALYPTAGRIFGFDCAELRAPPANGSIRLHLTQTLCHGLLENTGFDVRFQNAADHVLTWLAVTCH